MDLALGALGVPADLVGRSSSEILQRLLDELPAAVLSTVSRNCLPLMPFDIFICLFPDLLPPPVMEVPPQYSGC